MTLKRRLEHLERLRPPPPPDKSQAVQRQHQVRKRWLRLADAAGSLLTDEQRDGVNAAREQLRDHLSGPYGTWLQDLRHGWCRLPALAPAVMKGLLVAWLSPEADGGMVCTACGLEYPHHRSPPLATWKLLPGRRPLEGPPPWYDLPEFFMSCPHCQTSRFAMNWPHLVPNHDYAWKQRDGYVGVPTR